MIPFTVIGTVKKTGAAISIKVIAEDMPRSFEEASKQIKEDESKIQWVVAILGHKREFLDYISYKDACACLESQ